MQTPEVSTNVAANEQVLLAGGAIELCQPITEAKLMFIVDVYYKCSPAFRHAGTAAE